MKTIKCIFITHRIMDTRNRNAFQKPFVLSKAYTTDIFTVERVGDESNIDIIANTVNIYPGPNWSYPMLFPFWVIYHVWKKNRFIKTNIYTDWHASCLFTGWLLAFLGHNWVADLWEDPEKRILTWQESDVNPPIHKKIYHYFHKKLIPLYLLKAKSVVTCNTYVTDRYNIPIKKIIFHPNGVDLNHLTKTIDHLNKTIGKKKNTSKFTIVYVGPTQEVRIRYLEQLIKNIYFEIGDFVIKIIGNFEDNQITRNIKKLNYSNLVVDFTGWISHEATLEEIANADICLLPYPEVEEITNKYPIKLFEYMGMGKVVVASRLKIVSKIIENGKSGFLYAPADTLEAARIIKKIKNDPQLAVKVGHSAKETANSYDWSTILEKVIKQLPMIER